MALTQSVDRGVQQPVLSVPTKIGSAPEPFVQTQVDVWSSTDEFEVDIVGEMTDPVCNIFIVGLGGSG